MILWRRRRLLESPSRFARPRIVRPTRPEISVPGTITMDWHSYACRLHGLDPTGAILEIAAAAPPDLPRHFFVRPETDRTHRRVRLIWQQGRQAGVEFITRWSIRL